MHTPNWRGSRATALLALGLVITVSGCGGNTSVDGKVTYDGKPLAMGSVILVDGNGEVHQGAITQDGSYRIDGVPVGPVKIGVSSPKPLTPNQDTGKASRGGKTAPGGKGGPGGARGGISVEDPRGQAPAATQGSSGADQWFAIPDKYKDPETSGLTSTVVAGQPLNIDLSK